MTYSVILCPCIECSLYLRNYGNAMGNQKENEMWSLSSDFMFVCHSLGKSDTRQGVRSSMVQLWKHRGWKDGSYLWENKKCNVEETLKLILKGGWNFHRLRRQTALICSICQLLCCKYSHYGWFQVNDVISPNTELGRGASSSTPSMSHHLGFGLLNQSDSYFFNEWIHRY